MHNTIITLATSLKNVAAPAWASALGCTNLYGLVFVALFALGVATLWVGAFLVQKSEKVAFSCFTSAIVLLYGTFGLAAYIRYWL